LAASASLFDDAWDYIQSCVTEEKKRMENVGLFYSSVRNEKFETVFRAKKICLCVRQTR